jgi:hypothetical protein
MPSQITSWSDTLLASLSSALAMFFSSVPRILGFAVLLIAGWLIASVAEKVLVSLLRAIHFNDFSDRAGLTTFIQKADQRSDAAGVVGAIGKWFVRLIALIIAFDALGLPAVSQELHQLLMWLPNVVVALVALMIGGLAATALGNLVRGAAAEGGLARPELLAQIARVAVWAFAIVVAVNQVGIATTIVNTLFMATVGALALALGLAFGLGARDTAAAIVRRWYERGQQNAQQLQRVAEAAVDSHGSTDLAHAERRRGSLDRRHQPGRTLQ